MAGLVPAIHDLVLQTERRICPEKTQGMINPIVSRDVEPHVMTEKQIVNIDITKLSNLAHIGVRRAVLFIGLGLNAAHREDFVDYELRKIPISPGQTSLPIEFFPSNLPAERVKVFKEQFATWITGCGIRELLEHYALFLDQIHRHALLVLQVRGKLGQIDPKKEQKLFNRQFGIPAKLETLQNRFSIAPTDPESIKQLYHARNCLTHELGVVQPKRCDSDGHFVLTWKAFEVFAKGEKTGTERPITELIGKKTEEDTAILGRQITRERKFASGERLLLSKQDAWEICYFFNAHAIPSAANSFIKFLEANEVQINRV